MKCKSFGSRHGSKCLLSTSTCVCVCVCVFVCICAVCAIWTGGIVLLRCIVGGLRSAAGISESGFKSFPKPDECDAADKGRTAGEGCAEGAGDSDMALPPVAPPCWMCAWGPTVGLWLKEEGRDMERVERNERDGRRRGT